MPPVIACVRMFCTVQPRYFHQASRRGGVDTAALKPDPAPQPETGKHSRTFCGCTDCATHRGSPLPHRLFLHTHKALPGTSPGPSSPSLYFLPTGQRPDSKGPPAPDGAWCHCLSLSATPAPPSSLTAACHLLPPRRPSASRSAQLGASVSLPIHPASGEEESPPGAAAPSPPLSARAVRGGAALGRGRSSPLNPEGSAVRRQQASAPLRPDPESHTTQQILHSIPKPLPRHSLQPHLPRPFPSGQPPPLLFPREAPKRLSPFPLPPRGTNAHQAIGKGGPGARPGPRFPPRAAPHLRPPRRLCAAGSDAPSSPPCRPGSSPGPGSGTCFSSSSLHT